LVIRGAGQILPRIERPAFTSNPPDAAVLPIPAWVAEIDFSVVDDGIGPVGDIERAIWSEFHVDGSKGDFLAAQQVAGLLGDVTRALLRDAEANHTIGSEVARDEISLPIVRKVSAPDDLQRAELGIASQADAIEHAPCFRRGDVAGTGKPVVDSRAARTIGK